MYMILYFLLEKIETEAIESFSEFIVLFTKTT